MLTPPSHASTQSALRELRRTAYRLSEGVRALGATLSGPGAPAARKRATTMADELKSAALSRMVHEATREDVPGRVANGWRPIAELSAVAPDCPDLWLGRYMDVGGWHAWRADAPWLFPSPHWTHFWIDGRGPPPPPARL